jgi:metal-responsive CopG/Arc/MetJ family transcriptional regulator
MAQPTEGGKMNVLLLVEKKLLERVDDFRFAQRIPTRAEAMRRLIELGLVSAKPKAKAKKG